MWTGAAATAFPKSGMNNVLFGLVSAVSLAVATQCSPTLYLPRVSSPYLPDRAAALLPPLASEMYDLPSVVAHLEGLGVQLRILNGSERVIAVPDVPGCENRPLAEVMRASVGETVAACTPTLHTTAVLDLAGSFFVPSSWAKSDIQLRALRALAQHALWRSVRTLALDRLRWLVPRAPGVDLRGAALVGLHLRHEIDWHTAGTDEHARTDLVRRLVVPVVQLALKRVSAARGGDASASVVYVASGLSHDSAEIRALADALGPQVTLACKRSLSDIPAVDSADPVLRGALDMDVLIEADAVVLECDSSLSFHVLLLRMLAGDAAEGSMCWNRQGFVGSNSNGLFRQIYFGNE